MNFCSFQYFLDKIKRYITLEIFSDFMHNISMPNLTNNTTISNLFQPKLFNFLQYQISEDDPVRKLSEILEGLDFSNLMQVSPYKTKVYPIRMFAVIVFAYSKGIFSTRDIEECCAENIKFRYLLDDSQIPDHSTISRFLLKTQDILFDLFNQFVKKLLELENISTETIYIDGTKIEAYANKYSFVWKKAIEKNKNRLEEKILSLIENFNNTFNMSCDNFFEIFEYLKSLNISFVSGKGKRKSKEQKFYEDCKEYIAKYQEYSEHLDKLGLRNSYSKTDNSATFMRMKEDYMRNGQLKPAYNLQIGVISEYIVSFETFPNPSDAKTLVPFLKKIERQNINIRNVVANAGYESLFNYEYLEEKNYISYIKPIYYEKAKTRKFKNDLNRVENLIYIPEENRLFRRDGLEFEFLNSNKKESNLYFKNIETGKIIKYNSKFRMLSKKSGENIASEYGKQLRLNRSIQVEGAFAVLKEDMNLRKLKVRGKESVSREICLFCMAYNFNRYLSREKLNKRGTTLHLLKIA